MIDPGNADLICEDGVNACAPTETDCCDMAQPSCWTSTAYDIDGSPLVTVCNLSKGCNEGEK